MLYSYANLIADFVVDLVRYGAWPIVFLVIALRHGPRFVETVENLFGRLTKANTPVGNFELRAQLEEIGEEEKRLVETLKQVGDSEPQAATLTNDIEPYYQIANRLGDELSEHGFSAEFWRSEVRLLTDAIRLALESAGVTSRDVSIALSNDESEFRPWLEKQDLGPAVTTLWVIYQLRDTANTMMDIDGIWAIPGIEEHHEDIKDAYDARLGHIGIAIRALLRLPFDIRQVAKNAGSRNEKS